MLLNRRRLAGRSTFQVDCHIAEFTRIQKVTRLNSCESSYSIVRLESLTYWAALISVSVLVAGFNFA
jgi:hypothetical protein